MKSMGLWNTIGLSIMFLLLINIGQASQASGVDAITQNGVTASVLQSDQADGKVTISGQAEKEKIKILVVKEKNQVWYEAELEDGKFSEEIWLTHGKGTYTVAVMVNESERKYSYGPKFIVTNTQEINRFLVPTKHVESNAQEIIQLTQKITADKKSDIEKARAIYDWITSNIKYDYEKYARHKEKQYDNEYGALYALKSRKGVCYDYAALTAALGRAAGLQVKMVKGQGQLGSYNELHAWNEIYSAEEERWINVDTTFGAGDGKSFFDNADFDESHVKDEEY